MNIPNIKILSKDLKLLDEIDLYTSFSFLRSWQGIGEFTLSTIRGSSSLHEGNIIMLDGDGRRCGIIEDVEATHNEKGVTVTVRGKSLNSLTKRRIVLPSSDPADGGFFCVPSASSQSSYTSAESIIKAFASYSFGENASENRKFKNTVIAENRNRGIQTNWSGRYTELSEELESICKYCDCGYEFYIDLETRKYVFDYREGTDRSLSQNSNSRVILSTRFDSISSLSYSELYSNYKNIAYCGGKGEESERIILTVLPKNNNSQPEGFDRFETFIDCGSLESIESETAFSLNQEGRRKIEDYKAEESLNADIGAFGSFRYLEHWDLGDLVTVADDDLGLMQDKRITEIRENYEPGNIQIIATLGDVPVRLGKLLKRMKPPVK